MFLWFWKQSSQDYFFQIELTSSLIPICQLPNVLPAGFVPSIHLQICCFLPWLESSIVILILFELQSSPRRNLNPSFNSTCRKKQLQGKFLCSGLLCTWRDRRTELVVWTSPSGWKLELPAGGVEPKTREALGWKSWGRSREDYFQFLHLGTGWWPAGTAVSGLLYWNIVGWKVSQMLPKQNVGCLWKLQLGYSDNVGSSRYFLEWEVKNSAAPSWDCLQSRGRGWGRHREWMTRWWSFFWGGLEEVLEELEEELEEAGARQAQAQPGLWTVSFSVRVKKEAIRWAAFWEKHQTGCLRVKREIDKLREAFWIRIS